MEIVPVTAVGITDSSDVSTESSRGVADAVFDSFVVPNPTLAVTANVYVLSVAKLVTTNVVVFAFVLPTIS